ncbi:MAG: hypothetical protein QM783_16145 [Phycisphaerales bacterium]
MRTRPTFLLLLLCLAGFALSLYYASAQSGTEEGNLWLLTSLILGVGLISTCLAVIAQLSRSPSPAALLPTSPDRYARRNHPESPRTSAEPTEASVSVSESREHHRQVPGRVHESRPR